MEPIYTAFLLFVAAIAALLTYIVIPRVPVVALAAASSIALAAGVWWHWTQFAVDYRTSTWQEQLRNYASYVMVLVVILVSYAFYVFGFAGVTTSGPVAAAPPSYFSQITNTIRNTTSKITSPFMEEAPARSPAAPNLNMTNLFSLGQSANILA
jgi:hypothetical protein